MFFSFCIICPRNFRRLTIIEQLEGFPIIYSSFHSPSSSSIIIVIIIIISNTYYNRSPTERKLMSTMRETNIPTLSHVLGAVPKNSREEVISQEFATKITLAPRPPFASSVILHFGGGSSSTDFRFLRNLSLLRPSASFQTRLIFRHLGFPSLSAVVRFRLTRPSPFFSKDSSTGRKASGSRDFYCTATTNIQFAHCRTIRRRRQPNFTCTERRIVSFNDNWRIVQP